MGQTAGRELTVTEAMVRSYAEITGDYNPLHFDVDFASRTRFGRLIAQGGIATGLVHALVAMQMPGAGSVFTKQSWSFPKPVYLGDTLRAEATVLLVHARLPMAELRVRDEPGWRRGAGGGGDRVPGRGGVRSATT